MAVVALTRRRCMPFRHSGWTAAQCRTGNRRRRTAPATEPKRAAVEIALACTCATETRAAGEIPSIRGAPSGRPERPQSGGGDRCVARAGLRSLLSSLAAPSSAKRPLRPCPVGTDASREYRCRPDERYQRCTRDGRAPPAPSASGETC